MDDSDIEIILGICDRCNEYVPFLRLHEEPGRVYKCMTCKSKHTPVSYTHLRAHETRP